MERTTNPKCSVRPGCFLVSRRLRCSARLKMWMSKTSWLWPTNIAAYMGPRRRIDRLFDCVLTKPTSRPLMWLYCADTRCRHANLLELTTNDLRSFLAMTSSMMPVIINSKPAITSMTAPISVGKRNTTPVFIKSTVTVQHNINPTRPRMKPPDVYLEVQHPCWSCNSNSSSANASAGVR